MRKLVNGASGNPTRTRSPRSARSSRSAAARSPIAVGLPDPLDRAVRDHPDVTAPQGDYEIARPNLVREELDRLAVAGRVHDAFLGRGQTDALDDKRPRDARDRRLIRAVDGHHDDEVGLDDRRAELPPQRPR